MKIDIKKRKEIEFTQQLILLKNLIDNEPYIQKFIDTIDLDPNKIDLLKFDDIIPDIQFMQRIFERINSRTKFNTNNAGKNYEFFSKSDFSRFIQTDHFSQILSVKVLWNVLHKMRLSEKKMRDKIVLALFSLEMVEELEAGIQKMTDELLNSRDIRNVLLNDFPITIIINKHQFSKLPFKIEQDGTLVAFADDYDVEDFFENNDIPLYLDYNDRFLRISRTTFGYTLDYASTRPENSDDFVVEELKFEYGLFVSNNIEPDESYLDIPHQYLKFYRLPDTENIPQRAQSFYSIASELVDALNPLSYKPKEILKMEHTFISIIHSMVKSAFSEIKTSKHLILTISGLIAFDFGIIKLDYVYLPNDNSGAENEAFRKRVDWSINCDNRLKLTY